MSVAVFGFVVVVHAHDGACKGRDLAEADEQRFVYLALGRYIRAAKEEDETSDSQYGGSEELDGIGSSW